MVESQQGASQPKQRPKIKSSFGVVLKAQQQAATEPEQQVVSSSVPQSPSIPVDQDISIQTVPQKAPREKRTKKGVYLKPATAKWLDIQAATEGKEISEITEEALTLLQKIKSGKAEIVEM